MKKYELIISEKRGEYIFENCHKLLIESNGFNEAYDLAMAIMENFFNKYNGATKGSPDKDMIFWFNEGYAAVWLNTISELKV